MAIDALRLVMEGAEKVGNIGSGTSTGNGSGGFGGKGAEKTMGAQLKKMAGIDLGVGALLKQSQIFTGYLGNIFAIVGALIDTILAPLAPIAFKALADLGKKIPMFAEAAKKWIPKIVNFVGSLVRTVDKIGKFINQDWAKWMGIALGVLIAINVGVRTMGMTGRAVGSLTGLRSGGFLAKGAGLLSRTRLGGLARSGRGTNIIARGAATRAAPMAIGGAKAAGRVGGLARVAGGAARIAGGGAGGLLGGVSGYMGGRERGMSQGKSVGRGIAGGVGGAIGAGLGSFAGPLGTIAGGMVGATAGNWLFDQLFDAKKGGKAGGRTDEMGQLGLAGYSAPMVVAAASQKYSDVVEKSGQIIANSVIKHAGSIQEAGEVNKRHAHELAQAIQHDVDTVEGYRKRHLAELALEREIKSSAGKVGDLSFARGMGAGSIRSSATAMEFQAKQIASEMRSDKATGNYGIATELGFGKTGDYQIHQSGSKLQLMDERGTVDLNITFGGADGSQQILRYERDGKLHQIKMEEEVSTFGG